ncbi:hypothetical protein EYF80_039358 [Liparis tanakae]|uniref:Uncharacterized protein n=1 Tax=Liparis tanakae TaxID=230148 RepID=A0A4Z2GCS0_9TELE|nr:hypothetical protein EYF80_039358 [Liparis tanakae]
MMLMWPKRAAMMLMWPTVNMSLTLLLKRGGGEGGVVVNPSAATRNGRQVGAGRAVGQQLELRLCEHLAGLRGAIFSQREADGQSLLAGQIPEESSSSGGQRADVAAVRRRRGDEVVQQEVTGQNYPRDAQQDHDADLERPKTADFLQDILKLHLHPDRGF